MGRGKGSAAGKELRQDCLKEETSSDLPIAALFYWQLGVQEKNLSGCNGEMLCF